MFSGIDKLLAFAGDRRRLAEAVLSNAQALFGGDHGLLLEVEETTGDLREAASFGEVEGTLDQDMRIFAQYASDHPADPGSVFIVPDVSAEPKFAARKSVRRKMTLGVLIFPLASRGAAIGVIYLGEKKKGSLRFKKIKAKTLLETGAVYGELFNLERTMTRLQRENRSLKQRLQQDVGLVPLVGVSREIQRVRRSLELVIPTSIPVTLLGEPGTGKELFAEYIHRESPRRKKPFVAVHLSEVPQGMMAAVLFGREAGQGGPAHGRRGALREARGGTLLIHQVDRLPLDLQKRLVEALDGGTAVPEGNGKEYPVNVRLVTATSTNLAKLHEEKRLSEELFLKLNLYPILLPPLRDRLEDLPLLTEAYLEKASAFFGKTIMGVGAEVYDYLAAWHWPENLHELEQEIRHAVLKTPDHGRVTPMSLSPHLISRQKSALLELGEGTLKQRIARIEKRMIIEALEQNRHNQSVTAEQLGLSRQALINKLQRYGIETGRKYKRKMRELSERARREGKLP